MTVRMSPFGAIVMPSGALRDPLLDSVKPPLWMAVERQMAFGTAAIRLPRVSATYSVPLFPRARPVGARMSAALFARHG